MAADSISEIKIQLQAFPAGIESQITFQVGICTTDNPLVLCLPTICQTSVGCQVGLFSVGRIDPQRRHTPDGIDRFAFNIPYFGYIKIFITFILGLIPGFEAIGDFLQDVGIVYAGCCQIEPKIFFLQYTQAYFQFIPFIFDFS